MKNNITKDIEYMKYVLGYKRGVVISEQPIKKTSLSEQNNNEKPPVGCIDGDCESGKGTYKYSNGAEYTGQWEGGKRNGKGTNKYSSGAVYTGEWKEDKQDGPKGTFKTSKGTVYTGEFKDNKLLNGQVIYKLSNGNSRYGEWTNGVQGELKDGEPPKCIDGDCENGTGTYRYSNLNTYTGEFKDNLPNGQGTDTMLRDDKSIMFLETGEFKDGSLYNGQTTHIQYDGESFYREVKNGVVGEAKKGKPPEQNKETEQNNDQSTTGECTGNCKDGEGTYKDKDRVYSGKFKDGDLYNGIITFTSQDGNSKYSEVKDGEQGPLQDGKPPEQDNNKKLSVGCISGDCIDSIGTYKFLNGDEYTGEWKKGMRNGKGTLTYPDGVKISGNWVDGKLDEKQNNETELINKEQDKTQNNSGDCVQPTKPTHRYKNDRNYQYAKSDECWWAKNINNKKWINLTKLVKTKPNIKISIDKLDKGLENGIDLIKL